MRIGLWTGMFFRRGFTLEKTTELLRAAGFECAELCECFAGALPCVQVWQWSSDYPLGRVFGSDAHKPEMILFSGSSMNG